MTAIGTLIGKGVVGSRPSAGIAGQLYYATDVGNGQLQRDNGSSFDNLLPQELGYVETTTSQASIGTSATDLTSLTLTVTVGSRPIIVEAFLPLLTPSTTTSRIQVLLVDVTGSATIQLTYITVPSLNGSFGTSKIRVNPGAGSRTYKAQALIEAGTMTAYADANSHKWFRIYEV